MAKSTQIKKSNEIPKNIALSKKSSTAVVFFQAGNIHKLPGFISCGTLRQHFKGKVAGRNLNRYL